jgi:hypothetical protein
LSPSPATWSKEAKVGTVDAAPLAPSRDGQLRPTAEAVGEAIWCRMHSRFEEEPMKPLSEQLADLSARAKKAEDDAAAARKEARATIQARVEKLEADATTRSTKMKQSATQAKDTLAVQWADLQTTMKTQRDTIKSDIDARKKEQDAKRAENKADRAEDNAEAAIGFAYDAVEYAEAAVLDAVIARSDAEAIAGAS